MARLGNLVLLLVCALFVGNANAIPITIDASGYTSGTDITNAVSGVMLQQYNHMDGTNSITYSSAVVGNVLGMNILGTGIDTANSHGPTPSTYDSVLNGEQGLGDASYFSGLSILSEQAINSIEWTGFTIPGVLFTLKLFDQNDNYISSIDEYFNTVGSCDGHPCFVGNYNLDLTGQSVYRIAWSGLYDVASLESVTLNVPEPSSLALLGLGLLGLLLFPNLNRTLKLTKTRQ